MDDYGVLISLYGHVNGGGVSNTCCNQTGNERECGSPLHVSPTYRVLPAPSAVPMHTKRMEYNTELPGCVAVWKCNTDCGKVKFWGRFFWEFWATGPLAAPLAGRPPTEVGG